MGKPIVSNKAGTIAANGQTVVIDTSQANSAAILLSGTYSLTLVFEVSDDNATTWFPVQVAAANSNVTTASHSSANATIAYELNTSNYSRLRVRASAYTSGTLNVVLLASDAESEPNPNVTGSVSITGTPSVTATPASPTSAAVVSTASTNAAVIKSSAGSLFNVAVSNVTATQAFVKLYNKSTAPTVGTDVPVITIPVPANSTINFDIGSVGARFSSGIGRAVTGAAAATDTTNAVAGVQVLVTYI